MDAGRVFRHGVASGDPLTDRVILWTRATPPAGAGGGEIRVRWRIAEDEALTRIAAQGTAPATAGRDFTVKVDAGELQPGRTYFYAFDARGEQSPVGRTRTLPGSGVERLRLASVSCSNYPAGFFNPYRCIANRDDIDVVLHLGDYIYEFADGVYGEGAALNRIPSPPGEAVTIADYRQRYATYRSDIDLQDVHRRHPFIVVWDDHEIANDASSTGAPAHTAKQGLWAVRRNAAYQAYLDWMPVREMSRRDVRLYRSFRFGGLADLLMLDTRGLRDAQVAGTDFDALVDPRRSLLGAEQETWLNARMRDSQRAGTAWRILGQQVLFAPLSIPGIVAQNTDVWDGYPVARRRVFDMIAREKVTDVAIGLVRRHQRPIPVPADTAVMKVTSGSTGAPKVTATTEAQLCADARHIIDGMRVGPDDTQLAVIPLSHSYGFSSLVMPLLVQGTPIVLREAFVPSRLTDDARASGARVFPGVPFMFQRLLADDSTTSWPPQLRTLISAGAPLPTDTARRFLATFGVPIRSFYGTSETGGIAYDDDGHGIDEPGTIGRPLPGVTVTLRPEESVPPGTGRVFVQSAAVSSGYADGSGGTFTGGGYLTGDYGRFDGAGRLVLTGRVSSFVNVAGRKVDPAEVEHVLRQLPGVRDVCVMSAANAQRGERVVACVSATSPLTALSIRRFCARRLAPHKIPRQVVFVDAIPRTPRGKVDSQALRVLVEGLDA